MRSLRVLLGASALSIAILSSGCGGGGGGAGDATGNTSGAAAAITAVAGAQSSAVAGSTTPIALIAKVTDASGNGVGGVSVSWATQSGAISPASATTNSSGQSTAQWTPGTVAGSQAAVATASGVGSVSFPATVSPAALAKLKLTPDTTKLFSVGQTGVVTVTASDAYDNVIPASQVSLTFSSDNQSVATVNSSGTVTAVGNGIATITAAAGSINGTAKVVVTITSGAATCTSTAMTLVVGGSQTLSGTAASQFCVNGSAGAEFVAIPFYGTGNGGSGSGQGTFVAAPSLSLTFTPLVNTTVGGPPTPSVGVNTRVRTSVGAGADAALTRDVRWEARFRERVRKELRPLRAAARDQARKSSGLRKNLSISHAVVGETLQLNVGTNVCATPVLVPATVKAVGTHAIVVEDNRDPANGFTQADYDSFASVFDNQIWTVDTDNFGPPTDIDNNTHVILFFTRAVNELSAPNSSSFVGGFFYAGDLYPKSANCTQTTKAVGSNEAEMFYLLAPDPNGEIKNNVRQTSFVKSITAGTIAHEFQHLINFGYRLWDPFVFSDENFPEQTFLDEGLAHIAEELNFYAATGLSARSNLDATTATNVGSAYSAFADQNARRFREYLKNPDKYVPYSVLADTSLAVRGAIWSFLRYAADRKGGSEKSTWLNIVRPDKDVSGMSSLANTFGSDVLLQIRDWTVANYLDDALGVSIPVTFQNPSWNTRSVETYVNSTNSANGTVFPLKTNPFVTTAVPVGLSDGGAAYLRFGVPAGSVGGGTVTVSGALPSTFSITVVRTK